MQLSDFEVLTFDCYGTLIDWETGIIQALKPWLDQHGKAFSDDVILATFAKYESQAQTDSPSMLYPDILSKVHKALAKEWDMSPTEEEAREFAQSVKHWPAFPDSHHALKILGKYYKLVILSNIDNASFQASRNTLDIEFDAVFTAQDIASYKPSKNNFHYMLAKLADLGIEKNKILHTAQSLFHDHVPAKKLGLATCWIDRRHANEGWGATMPPQNDVKPDFRFAGMEEMASAREKS